MHRGVGDCEGVPSAYANLEDDDIADFIHNTISGGKWEKVAM